MKTKKYVAQWRSYAPDELAVHGSNPLVAAWSKVDFCF